METKGELDIEDLQQWQRDILDEEDTKDYINTSWLSHMRDDIHIPISKAQRDMLEKVLGDDFFIGDEKVREILEAVFECGFYYERDRKVLNRAREEYLKGNNWIKVDS